MELDKKQWTLYHKSGLVYFFYFDNQDLYMKIMRDNEIFYKVKVLENVSNYSVAIDDNDEMIHLVAILESGDLKYCIYKDNEWDWRYLSKYDPKSYQFKNLMMFMVDDNIHILMAISNVTHFGLWILKHHYWDQKNWISKKVCNIITEKYDIPFQADIDNQNNIHVVFRTLCGNTYQIFYSRYSNIYRFWSQPVNISDTENNHSHPFIFCDNQNKVHITWCRSYKNDLAIYYLSNDKIDSLKNNWKKPVKLTVEGINGIQPLIYQVDQYLQIIWKQNNHIFVTKNFYLSGETWGDLKEIEMDNVLNLISVSIIGNKYPGYNQVKIPSAYGIIDYEEIFLIGLDEILIKNKSVYDKTLDKELLYNKTKDLSLLQKDYTEELKEDKDTNIQWTLEDVINIIERLKNDQKKVDEFLFHIKEEQKINKQRLKELAHLYLELNEKLIHYSNNNSFLKKLKMLFKI